MKRDYFAELFVAGLLANHGWNIYFPHRDEGFDFIISKNIGGVEVIRPVQVKGKYPTIGKEDKAVYGFVGQLSKLHPHMVLVIPYFKNNKHDGADLVAYLPLQKIKPHTKGYHCEPAKFTNGEFTARRDFTKYFNEEGLSLIESETDFNMV